MDVIEKRLGIVEDTLIALLEWHATEGNPRYTFWMEQGRKIKKASPSKEKNDDAQEA